MSIRLLQALLIAGVHSPADGSTLYLSPATEAELVGRGVAEWVRRPRLAVSQADRVAAAIELIDAEIDRPPFRSSLKNRAFGSVIFGDLSGDRYGSSLRPQDHIVVTALASATLQSASLQRDAFGAYYEIKATGAAGSSSGFVEFEIGYDQQQFQADRVTLAADFDPVNVMSIAASLGVLSNYTINAAQTVTIGVGSSSAFNGRNAIEFRSDAWTKTGFATAMETANFKRLRFNFTLRQNQPVTIKVREARAGLGQPKGRLAIVADDYYHSFVRRGAPILASRGLVSSMALIPASVGALTSAVLLPELLAYVDQGNECIVHGPTTGTNWFAAPYTTLAARMAEARYGRDYILENRLGSVSAANSVAYPQGVWQSGSYETDFLDALIADGFVLGRASGGTGPNGRFFNRAYMRDDSHARFTLPTIGHSYAGASNTLNDATETSNIATIVGYIQSLGTNRLDGVLNFHSIVDDGAANQTYHCELSRCIALSDAIAAEVAANKLDVVRFSEFA